MTDCARLLEVLTDHKPHSHSELYGLGMIVHSRVAELRKRGHNIICTRERTHVDEKRRPVFVYRYQLIEPLGSREDTSPDLPDLAAAANATVLTGYVAASREPSGSALTDGDQHGEAEPLQLTLGVGA